MSDNELIQRIKIGEKSELVTVYKRYRTEFLNWAVNKYGCTLDEAKDVYQHSILIFYEKIIQDKLTFLTSSIKTYLFAIGKNQVLEKIKRNNRYSDSSQFEASGNMFYSEELNQENESRLNLIEKCLEDLGDPCRALLVSYYYEKKSMLEISDNLGYKNTDTTKNQKYKCLKRLKKLFIENS
jgi:RNA polymerase sigma factor (sigma-70 family)